MVSRQFDQSSIVTTLKLSRGGLTCRRRHPFMVPVASRIARMHERDTLPETRLVPHRTCGPCNVCCVALTIDDKALRKVQGYRCPNTSPDKSCAIYETRPDTCRTFFCGWRQLKWIRETLRPDLSGVLVRLHYEVSTARNTTSLGVVFTLLNGAALKADGLAESVAAAVAAGVPVYLHVPGPPGYTSSQARINEVLSDAVAARDKTAVLRILREARAKGRSGKHEPVVLARGDTPDVRTSNDP
jgi:Fe-S-cluster containining protein